MTNFEKVKDTFQALDNYLGKVYFEIDLKEVSENVFEYQLDASMTCVLHILPDGRVIDLQNVTADEYLTNPNSYVDESETHKNLEEFYNSMFEEININAL
jgi:hypothetical protein